MRQAFTHLLVSFTSRRTDYVTVSVIFRLSSAELWLKLRVLRWRLWRSFMLCWLSASTDTGTTATRWSSFRWDITPALLPNRAHHSQRQGALTDHHLVREEVTIAPGVSPPYVSSALKLLPAEYPAGLLG